MRSVLRWLFLATGPLLLLLGAGAITAILLGWIADTKAAALSALFTMISVVAALFKDTLLDFAFNKTISLRWSGNDSSLQISRDSEGQVCDLIWRIEVENTGGTDIEDLEIRIASIKKQENGWTEVDGFVPVSLAWTHRGREAVLDNLPTKASRWLDLGRMLVHDSGVSRFYLLSEISDRYPIALVPGTYEMVLKAYGKKGVDFEEVWYLFFDELRVANINAAQFGFSKTAIARSRPH